MSTVSKVDKAKALLSKIDVCKAEHEALVRTARERRCSGIEQQQARAKYARARREYEGAFIAARDEWMAANNLIEP